MLIDSQENNKIFITRPLLPDFDEFVQQAKEIFDSKWLTNMGSKHNQLEEELKNVLKVDNVSLFNNGTLALLVGIQALNLPKGSEVITTPFTFAATPHCISWNGLKPVFCDIESATMCIDADKIEELITPNTSAICGVHVYGFPCDVEKIDKIAKKYNLKVIYDAAHAFSTEVNGKSIGEYGDITMYSFHSTKLFNTIEGGCLTYKDEKLKEKIFQLRNFGIVNQETVSDIGINGKMNEFQAVFGLLNLKIFREEQVKRQKIKEYYDEKISRIKGIRIPQMPVNATNSYQYYPIVIEDDFPLNRDELFEKFKENNVFVRKYFYPACSDFGCYKDVKRGKLNILNSLKHRVLALPYYGSLDKKDLNKICKIIEG